MKITDKTWAYTMLVDKPIIESLSAIAMHLKVDASRYIHMLSIAELGSVRTVVVEGIPHFVGKDVADILGYINPQKAIRTHVDSEDKGMTEMDTPGGVQELVVINESGLYSLILSSKPIVEYDVIDVSSSFIWSYFDTNEDMLKWQKALSIIYGQLDEHHIQLRVLSMNDIMSIPIETE